MKCFTLFLARPRKQESPQPLVKLEKSSPSPGDSTVPCTPVTEDRDGTEPSLYKRPRGSSLGYTLTCLVSQFIIN